MGCGAPLMIARTGSKSEGCEDAGPVSPKAQAACKGETAFFEVTQKITSRYAQFVKEAELLRVTRLRPIDQQELVHPDERGMVRSMKTTLDCARRAGDGNEVVEWDKLLTTDDFQKQLEFLYSHSRTGFFIEQYGTEGRYEGEFLYGLRHGRGVHEFRDEVYDGEWKWDNRHGWGTLTLGDGSKIQGNWQGGKPHGFACIIDKKDSVLYEGEFKEGKRHGLGRQIFESGDMYDGGWKDGKLHDRGVYYFTNGDKLYGMWNQGLYDGIGVFHYADGSISRRVYKDGVLVSVQDYEHSSQKFGKTLTRTGMQKHTQAEDFPKEIFLLSSI